MQKGWSTEWCVVRARARQRDTEGYDLRGCENVLPRSFVTNLSRRDSRVRPCTRTSRLSRASAQCLVSARITFCRGVPFFLVLSRFLSLCHRSCRHARALGREVRVVCTYYACVCVCMCPTSTLVHARSRYSLSFLSSLPGTFRMAAAAAVVIAVVVTIVVVVF